jgi:4-hydroxy-3-methylbut-2-enyl diphosphate reductase
VEEIVDKLKARYDVTLEVVSTATESVIFKLPRTLQTAAAQ